MQEVRRNLYRFFYYQTHIKPEEGLEYLEEIAISID